MPGRAGGRLPVTRCGTTSGLDGRPLFTGNLHDDSAGQAFAQSRRALVVSRLCPAARMSHELPKTYDPGVIEVRWAEDWIPEKLFSVDRIEAGSQAAKPPVFTLLLEGLRKLEADLKF